MRCQVGDCVFDTVRRKVDRGGNQYLLEPKAFELLALLVSEHPRVVSKDEIINRVWDGRAVTDAVLTTTIRKIRHAIDPSVGSSSIATVRKVGYRIDANVSVLDGDAVANEASSAPGSPIAPATPSDARPMAKFGIAVLPFDNMSPDRDQAILPMV